MPLPSFRFSKCPWFFIKPTVADRGSTVFHEEEKKRCQWWEMSSSYFCCSSWTPSSLWTRRTPPVSKVLWWHSCIHTPLGVYIDLKKQGTLHQKCLNKCKHMYLIFREMSHAVQLLSSPMIRWMLRKMMKRASDPIQNSLVLSQTRHCRPLLPCFHLPIRLASSANPVFNHANKFTDRYRRNTDLILKLTKHWHKLLTGRLLWTLGEATLTENFTHMPQQLPRACREGEEQGKNLTHTKEDMKRKGFVFFPESPQPPLTPTWSSFSDVKIQRLERLTKR